MTLELPEQYLLGASPAVYAVYTVNGGTKQESASVRVPATITGLEELLERNTGVQLGSGPQPRQDRGPAHRHLAGVHGAGGLELHLLW